MSINSLVSLPQFYEALSNTHEQRISHHDDIHHVQILDIFPDLLMIMHYVAMICAGSAVDGIYVTVVPKGNSVLAIDIYYFSG